MTSSRVTRRTTSALLPPAVGAADDLDRMLGLFPRLELDLHPRERTIGRDGRGFGLRDPSEQAARDLQRHVEVFLLEAPRAVDARAALDELDLGVRKQLHEVARLEADVLHAKVTRYVIGDASGAGDEPRVELL